MSPQGVISSKQSNNSLDLNPVKGQCPMNGRRKITQNSTEVDAETKEGTRKTEEKLNGSYKEGQVRKKPK